MTRRTIHAAVSSILLASTAFAASAQGPGTLREMIDQADLVFLGEAVHVQYVLSLPTGQDAVGVPHSFVTYRVDHVLAGSDPGAFLTLRFLGGLNEDTGIYLRASDAPQFDVGDRDILFVKGNTELEMPLIGNSAQGRLRLIDGQVYSELGQAVSLSDDGVIARGPRYLLEEVATTSVNGEIIYDDPGQHALTGRSDAADADDLLEQLEDLGRRTRRERRALVAQADPSVPFEAPDMTPVPAPADPPALGAAQDVREGDVDEIGIERSVQPRRR